MKTETTVKADATLDLTGLTCPTPLLGARRVLEDLQPGQVLALVSDCPGARDDFFVWTRHTEHEIVSVDESAPPKKVFYIRKGKRQQHRADVILDMTGISCPRPIIEAKKLLDDLEPGEILKLVASCPASRDEVSTWTSSTGVVLLSTRECASGVWEFYLRKT